MFNGFRGLGAYAFSHRREWILGLAAVFLAVFASLYGPPRIVGLLIDELKAGTADQGTIVRYAALLLGAAAASSLLYLASRRLIMNMSRYVSYEVRRNVFTRLTLMDQGYYHRTRTGDLMNRLTADLMAVQEMLSFATFQGANMLVLIPMSLALMFALSPQLGLIVLAVFPFIIGFLVVMTRIIAKRYVAVQEQGSNISARAQENFSGIRVVKGYAVEDREIEAYKGLNLEYRKRVLSLAKVEAPLWATVGLLMNAVFVTVLLVGGRQLVRGGAFAGLTIGEFVQFVYYLFNLSWPVLALGFISNSFQRGASSWGRIRELLEMEPEIRDDGRTDRSITALRGDIAFEDVSLQHEGRKLLDGVTLRVRRGTTLGITGRTGSGKTLLANLVWRGLDPTRGRVLVDGHDVKTIPLAVLRQHIGMVPQEPFLFSDTIAENLAFGLPERVRVDQDLPLDEETYRWAARVAGLAKDVEDFTDQYDTMLGERGVTLSGGQRQRTALGRAIARKPEILILDDSMSAVDTETEARILNELKTVLEDRTVLLIGHRVSTLRFADHIIVLDHGRIVEQGSHEELLALGGLYAEMDRKQGIAGSVEVDPDGDEAGATFADELKAGVRN